MINATLELFFHKKARKADIIDHEDCDNEPKGGNPPIWGTLQKSGPLPVI